MLVLLCMAVFTSLAMAQNPTYAAGTTGGITGVDKLGAHSNGGRGCVGCHAPHSGGYGAGGNAGTGTTVDTHMGNDALWGQDMGPLYGQTLLFGDNGQYAAALPAMASFEVGSEEIRGIMMCLSCHDGNIAKGAMMTNQSWEQKMNLLPTGVGGKALYGTNPIPTLLGNDGTAAGNYNNDHPVGTNATLGKLGLSSRFTVGTCGTAPSTYNCLVLNAATDTNGAYQAFVNHYGAPQVLPGRASFIVLPDTNPANAFVVCTTCHTPHSMYTYSASNTPGGKVATNTSGTYPSYFFVYAPYNPGSQPTAQQASSATQFCRQCHFTGAGGSNEGSGIMNVTTAF
jgi:hypothetical protein